MGRSRLCPPTSCHVRSPCPSAHLHLLTFHNNSAGTEPWTFSGEDIRVWEQLLTYTLDKALDNGTESGSILEEIAATVHEHHIPTWTSATRITDLIVSKLGITNLKETSALKLANQTLISAYSAPRDTVITTWLIRSLTRIVEESPISLAPCVLDQVQEGLSLWFADESSVFSAEEYEFDVRYNFNVFIYRHSYLLLLGFDGLPNHLTCYPGTPSTAGNY